MIPQAWLEYIGDIVEDTFDPLVGEVASDVVEDYVESSFQEYLNKMFQ